MSRKLFTMKIMGTQKSSQKQQVTTDQQQSSPIMVETEHNNNPVMGTKNPPIQKKVKLLKTEIEKVY